jgi:Concanavalin A-like lectin/glucanases superfamily
MTICLRFLWIFTILAAGSSITPAAPAGTNQPGGFCLTIELQDGSKIIGKNGDDNFQFRSDVLGEMKLSLERIRSIECQPKTNSVRLTTANGDNLTAQFVTKAVRVETVFGSVKLPVNSIRRLLVSATEKPGQMREGLVALWSGEGNGDDSTGHNNAVLTDVAFAGGRLGQAFSFGGGGGVTHPCVQVPFAPNLINPSYSVDAWIKPLAPVNDPAGAAVIFEEPWGAPQLVIRTGFSGVKVAFFFATSRSSPLYEVVSTSEIPLGQFSHIAGTWDGTTLRLYINGILNNQNTPGVSPVPSGCPFYIGGMYNPVEANNSCHYVGQFFNGLIDEIALYNRALSASEIQADYQAGDGL